VIVDDCARIGSLSHADFRTRLRGAGLGVRLGPFDFCLQVRVPQIEIALYELYRHFPVIDLERVFSGHVKLAPRRAWRSRPFARVRFAVDGRVPHEDMPASQALAVLEWGLNLVMSARFHRFLILHCAVLERHGRAVLLPAAPGDGKTTLCAAMAHRGWRLFSDEFGLVRPGLAELVPVPRPMPLKNESIAVIRAFAPEAHLGPEIAGTRKGTIAHVRPPLPSVTRAVETAPARWIVFPRWQAGATLSLRALSSADAFVRLATNAFNYELLGESAFVAVRDLVQMSRCFHLVYSDLEEAISSLNTLADSDVA
jgi:HprK-related kinase A